MHQIRIGLRLLRFLRYSHGQRKVGIELAFEYRYIEVHAIRHVGDVLVEDGPSASGIVVPGADRMVVVLTVGVAGVPVLSGEYDGVGIVIGQWMVDLGPV